jgi:hypothetical protein
MWVEQDTLQLFCLRLILPKVYFPCVFTKHKFLINSNTQIVTSTTLRHNLRFFKIIILCITKNVLTNVMSMVWTCLTATVFVKFKSLMNYPTFLTGVCNFILRHNTSISTNQYFSQNCYELMRLQTTPLCKFKVINSKHYPPAYQRWKWHRHLM